MAEPNGGVAAGAVLLRLEDPVLVARLEAGKVGEAKVAFAEAKKLADPEDPRVAEVKAKLDRKTGQ